ncbi:MAG: alpha-1,2-fucosyltransferase [Eubacteriales bacterium]|nr:alpha-1,2-fucosyltransferase [Eubacteriales bacterium]
MIYVEMNGRLGNQMFRYAFARRLQLESPDGKEPLAFDFSNIYAEKKKDEMPGWEDSLRHFQVVPYEEYKKEGKLIWNETNPGEKAVLALAMAGDRLVRKKGTNARLSWRKHFFKWQNAHGIYQIFVGYDYPFQWVKKENKIVAGPFECARYCEEIRDVLVREFTPKYPVLEKNQAFFEKIRTTNSVCITIRRGNYLQYKALDVCTVDYFRRAVEKMRELVKDPVFFVFSDEIGWAKENLPIDGEVYYETGDDPVWEKLRLMYSCKHFIISNSTFSWWAQFLGQAPEKEVIAPKPWFHGEYQPPLYEKGWHVLEV